MVLRCRAMNINNKSKKKKMEPISMFGFLAAVWNIYYDLRDSN